MKEEWKYYNHAMIPTCAPHERPDLEPIKNGTIWQGEGKHALFARWTEDFDCGNETDWWYIIRSQDPKFELERLNRKNRKNIRKALKNCNVKKIDPVTCKDDLWRVYQEAIERYSEFDDSLTKKEFYRIIEYSQNSQEYWAGYDKISGRMIGYKICSIKNGMVEFSTSKYSCDFLNLRVSDALNYKTIDYYLNIKRYRYICNGSRSINHKTNVQNYYIERFGFRKAYCKLYICYRFPFGILTQLPFSIMRVLSVILKNRKILGVLKMEEIRRSFATKKNE